MGSDGRRGTTDAPARTARPEPPRPARPKSAASSGAPAPPVAVPARPHAPRRALPHEVRVLLVALAGGAPSIAVALWALNQLHVDRLTLVTVGLVLIGTWLGAAVSLFGRVTRPLHTLSNMLAALREGDFSIRARGAQVDSAMGLALWEVNALADTLRQQRLGALEATALLRRVMDSIDVALFAFDDAGMLRLVNREGEDVLGRDAERALGHSAIGLGLGALLEGETPRLVDLQLAGRGGRWELRRGTYRDEGRPLQLVVLSDLTRALREEERQAWQRLVRVLSHEINNSLAPIQSLAQSLSQALEQRGVAGASDDLSHGLGVIETRSRSLARFMREYARLARLPRPTPGAFEVASWVDRVSALEARLSVAVVPGPPLVLEADGDQLEQVLINLVRNAADAALESGGGVCVTWKRVNGWCDVHVLDEGPGIADGANLFVPFFTTKPEGTGIGLALSRQIAEAHGGSLILENRADRRGCVARLRLPLA